MNELANGKYGSSENTPNGRRKFLSRDDEVNESVFVESLLVSCQIHIRTCSSSAKYGHLIRIRQHSLLCVYVPLISLIHFTLVN